MRIDRTVDYPAPPDTVVSMSCDRTFQERKCADAGALSWSVRVTETGGATVVSTRRTLPTTGFPSLLRKLLPPGLVSTETVSWANAPGPDGSRTARLEVEFHGAPATMTGTVRVAPDGPGSRITVAADFRAQVPLVAGKVEKLASPIILDVIDSEQRTGRAWLAGAR